jgi:hypothetical protein
MVYRSIQYREHLTPIDDLIGKLHCSDGFKCGCDHPQHVLDAVACLIASATNAASGMSKADLETAMRNSTPHSRREAIGMLLDASCEQLRQQEKSWHRDNYGKYAERLRALLNPRQMRLAKTVFDVSVPEEERAAAEASFRESMSDASMGDLESMLRSMREEDEAYTFEALLFRRGRWGR